MVLAIGTGAGLSETVQGLPPPKDYVSDFAGALSADTVATVDAECRELEQKAHAQIAVVTIKTIDPDKTGAIPSIEEFATALEDKWKVGTKGTDRGVLMLLVMTPRRGRIEVGYGLEGILNDARVGDIGREMSPYAQNNDYDHAVRLGVDRLAAVIAADAGVALNTPITATAQYHWQRAPQTTPLKLWQVAIGAGVVLLILILLASTGNLGVLFWLLLNMLGAGGGGGGERRGGGSGDDGGFGGFGGGQSGGGGASGDF
ncbi:MAG: TPM domain-containing protein [Acidobacteriota bacterium]|nr:TPM domain-containing protein [Acidobacteriota bacterium]